jgi:predicted DsbA family dithiol-disulfide isomerase
MTDNRRNQAGFHHAAAIGASIILIAVAMMRDAAEALRLGINGTPSFVFGRIEGDELSVAHLSRGAPGYEALAQVIDKLLKPENAGAIPGTK